MMTLILAAVVLFLCWIFRERIGSWVRVFRSPQKTDRVLYEDALKHVYKCTTSNIQPSIQSVAGQLEISLDRATYLLSEMRRGGLLEHLRGGDIRLTPEGQEYALHVIRAHRLWELYLADRTGVAEVEWHGKAERLEHELSPEQANALSAELGNPTFDPHGDPVPTAQGRFPSVEGVALTSLAPGQLARIIHVEDEPQAIYAELVKKDIFPGMEFRVVDVSEDWFSILTEGRKKEIGSIAAGNVTAEVLDEFSEPELSGTSRLSDLAPGDLGTVVHISKASRGTERRRFMDLGILPGTTIAVDFDGPSGDPTAYRVRGAVIALRNEQARHIFVRKTEKAA